MRRRCASSAMVIMASALVMSSTGIAYGQDTETQALRKEVEELKQKVQKLEEAQQASKTQPARAGPSGAPDAVSGPNDVGKAPGSNSTNPSASRGSAAVDGNRKEALPSDAGANSATSNAVQRSSQPETAAREPSTTHSAKAQSASMSVPALRESWGRVNQDMSQTQIAELLGAPTVETFINGRRVWYYYYPGIGGASVFFKGNGRVSSHQAPFIGWW